MNEWKQYKRKGSIEARPYVPGEDLDGISVSNFDNYMNCLKLGGMIARNPSNPDDQWFINETYFKDHYEVE